MFYPIIGGTKNETKEGQQMSNKGKKQFLKIKARLVEKNLRQSDLAKHLGISTQSLNRKLNGISDFRLSELEEIAKILDIDEHQYREYFF